MLLRMKRTRGKNHGAALRERANNTLVEVMHVRLCVCVFVCVSEHMDLSYE